MTERRYGKSVRGPVKRRNRYTSVSFTSLRLLEECPRCFVRHVKGERRPSFPAAGILFAMDIATKGLIGKIIGGQSPPQCLQSVPGRFVRLPQATMRVTCDEFRLSLVSKLDALIVSKKDYLPWDNKTAGRRKSPEAIQRFFGLQGCIYNFVLRKLGYRVRGESVFCEWFPHVEPDGTIRFETAFHLIETPVERATNVLRQAQQVLDGPVPDPDPNCDYCTWALKLNGKFANEDAR